MNWHRAPELLDRLAAEYALGTLAGGARRRFEAVMRQQPQVARAAAAWATRLQPLDARLEPLPADERLWSRIEAQAFGRAASARNEAPPVGAAPARGDSGRAASWWQRWFGPVPAAALSLGLVLGLALPLLQPLLQRDALQTQLPESYVGVLATAEGKPGLIVSSLRRGHTVDLKVLSRAAVPAGQVLVLWTLDARGVAQAVGALPPLAASFVSFELGHPAEDLFARAVELAVSVEPAGALLAAPGSAFVYRGLCGKLWPLKPPAQGPAASR